MAGEVKMVTYAARLLRNRCTAVVIVKHIVTGSADLVEIRKKYFDERALYAVFHNVSLERVFDFFREGVFYQI